MSGMLKIFAACCTAAVCTLLVSVADASAASLAASASAGAVADGAVTVTASGIADSGDLLFVEAEEVEPFAGYSRQCQTLFPGFGTKISSYSGDTVGAGSFSKTYTFTPPKAGSWNLCGYLDEASYEAPAATSFSVFSVAAEAGTVAPSVAPAVVDSGQPTSITVSGTTNVAAKLVVKVQSYGGCEPGLILISYGTVTPEGGDPVAVGGYTRTYSYTPTGSGTYTVCAYLGNTTSSFLSSFASASAPFTVRTEEEEEQAHRKARAEEKSRESAQAAAEYSERRAVALEKPVRRLRVQPVGHNYGSSGSPGYTNLDVTTSAFAHVTVKLARHGHATVHIEWGEHTTAVAMVVPWSCRRPGGTYTYTVTARTNVGRTLTRRGRFSPVSVARCHFLERQEAEARAQENREAVEKYEREERAARERVEHYEHNCRALGGTPVELEVAGEERIYCRGPYGPILVPH